MQDHSQHVARQMTQTADRYSPQDIAEVTERHPDRRHLRSGDLKGHKMGGEWIVFPDAIRDRLGDEVYENLFLPRQDEA